MLQPIPKNKFRNRTFVMSSHWFFFFFHRYKDLFSLECSKSEVENRPAYVHQLPLGKRYLWRDGQPRDLLRNSEPETLLQKKLQGLIAMTMISVFRPVNPPGSFLKFSCIWWEMVNYLWKQHIETCNCVYIRMYPCLAVSRGSQTAPEHDESVKERGSGTSERAEERCFCQVGWEMALSTEVAFAEHFDVAVFGLTLLFEGTSFILTWAM